MFRWPTSIPCDPLLTFCIKKVEYSVDLLSLEIVIPLQTVRQLNIVGRFQTLFSYDDCWTVATEYLKSLLKVCNFNNVVSDCVHTMPAHFENGEKFNG